MKNQGKVQKWEKYDIPLSCRSLFGNPDVKLAKNIKELENSFIGRIIEQFLRRMIQLFSIGKGRVFVVSAMIHPK